MEHATILKPFPLGRIFIAPQAEELLTRQEIARALRRHARGDWGEVRVEEVAENELALQEGRCVASFFRNAADREFCVMTDGRRTTTLVVTYLDG